MKKQQAPGRCPTRAPPPPPLAAVSTPWAPRTLEAPETLNISQVLQTCDDWKNQRIKGLSKNLKVDVHVTLDDRNGSSWFRLHHVQFVDL